MNMEIRIAQNQDAREWDAIVSASAHGTIFHTWKWLQIAEKHTHSMLYPIIGTQNGATVGIIPLFFQQNGPVRMVFSPPPRAALFYLGPVLVDYDVMNQETRELHYIEFQKTVDTFIKNVLKADYISISLSPSLQDPRPFVWSGYTPSLNFDYVIDLNLEIDSLFQTLNKKQRQNLNRAKRRGITVEIGAKKEFEKILELMDVRYSQQGKHVMESSEYFSDIYDAFEENLKIFVAKIDGEIITGNIDLQYRDTHYSWIGNPKPKKPIAPSPNDLLIYESVRIAQEQGFKYYVTMNAAGDNRLHSFYASKFDPELKAHFSVKKCSYLAGLLEKGYSDVIKPVRGKVMGFTQ